MHARAEKIIVESCATTSIIIISTVDRSCGSYLQTMLPCTTLGIVAGSRLPLKLESALILPCACSCGNSIHEQGTVSGMLN